MSTSSVSAKSGAVALDSAIRRVTVCCRRVSSCTSTSPLAPASPRVALGLACARASLGCVLGSSAGSALAPPSSAAASTSAFTIRPPGPEPSSRASSTPSSPRHPPRDRRGLDALAVAAAVSRLGRSSVAVAVFASALSGSGSGVSASGSGSSPPAPPSPPRSAGSLVLVLGAARRLAGLADPRDHLADRERVALLGQHLHQHAVGVGLVGHVGLVGLDLHERLAALHLAALLHEPLEHRALLHGVGQARHRDVAGHQTSLKVARAACTTCSSCGNAACSSGLE